MTREYFTLGQPADTCRSPGYGKGMHAVMTYRKVLIADFDCFGRERTWEACFVTAIITVIHMYHADPNDCLQCMFRCLTRWTGQIMM